MAYNKIESLVLTYLEPIVKKEQVEIWDIEFKKEGPDYVLRVFLDKEDGISINDCEAVSRALEEVLDKEDPISQAYLLEVSSAGLDRSIKNEMHYQKCMGKNVDVKLFAAYNGTKEFTARLTGYTGKEVSFDLDGEAVTLPLDKISTVKLTVEF